MLAEAALRVRRGEERARVEEELAKQGIAAVDLDWQLVHLPTIADAERTAAKDFVAEGRQASRDYYAQPFVLKHIADIVDKRARHAHISFEAAEEQFWTDLISSTHTHIIDRAFTMPDRKGILVNR